MMSFHSICSVSLLRYSVTQACQHRAYSSTVSISRPLHKKSSNELGRSTISACLALVFPSLTSKLFCLQLVFSSLTNSSQLVFSLDVNVYSISATLFHQMSQHFRSLLCAACSSIELRWFVAIPTLNSFCFVLLWNFSFSLSINQTL